MTKTKKTLLISLIALIVVCVCVSTVVIINERKTTIEMTASNPDEITITAGTVGQRDGLSIGVMNIVNDETRLSIWRENEQSIKQTLKVGETTQAFGHVIEVLAIKPNTNIFHSPGSSNGRVKLRVTTVK